MENGVEYFYQWEYTKNKDNFSSLGSSMGGMSVGAMKNNHGKELRIFIEVPKFPTEKPYPYGW